MINQILQVKVTFKFLKVDCWRDRSRGVKIAYSVSLEVRSFLCSGTTDFFIKGKYYPLYFRSMVLTSSKFFL